MARWWLVLAIAGCGRISFSQQRAGGGDDVDGGATGPCDLTAPFSAPVAIAELNTAVDDAIMRLTADELTAVFYRNDKLQIATRASRGAKFGAPVALDSLNTAAIQEDPAISDDALAILFRSARAGGVGGSDLYSATRATTATAFGNVQLVGNVNTTFGDVQPYLGPDGLYFASNRGGGSYDPYFAAGSPATGFAAPAKIAILASPSDDESPLASVDGLALYFASDRPGGAGGRDIWEASRASTTVPFGAPVHIAELATPGTDSATWLSPDGCRLYITQHPTGGDADLYVANR